MAQENLRPEIERFILEEIDSVPHLEALLLLRKSAPKKWSPAEMADALYIAVPAAEAVLQDLEQRGLATGQAEGYTYAAAADRDHLIEEVEKTYSRQLVRIATMIHAKASPSVRAFARAFELKKE